MSQKAKEFCFIVFGVPLVLVSILLGSIFFKAYIKADVINDSYGTNYSALQVMAAEDVIEEIREVKRTRIELNGNLINGEM